MTQTHQTLAALIGSRICHDLISPIGAINNGLELLEMSGAPSGPEMALIAQSCSSANARIRFFRLAFGAASSQQMISAREVIEILDDVARGGRIRFDWRPKEDLPRSEVQLACLAIQCLETALHTGGVISAVYDNGRWRVFCSEGTPVVQGDPWSALDPDAPSTSLRPAEVQFALLPLLAAEIGRSVVIVSEPDLTLVV